MSMLAPIRVADSIPVSDADYQANEAYESMSRTRLFSVFLLFSASTASLLAILFILPGDSLVQQRPFEVTENATDVVLQLVYEERKAYQPFVTLSIDYLAAKGRATTLALKYHVEILRGLSQVAQSDTPAKPIKLSPGSSINLINVADIDATKFVVTGTTSLVEGTYDYLYLVWRHFNSNFALFVIFIDCVLAFVLVMTALSLSFRISSLSKRVATLASRFEVVFLLVAAFLILPFPELVYLDLLYWIRSYTWLFQVLYRVLFLVVFDTLCWNLRYREQEEEKWLYGRRTFLVFGVLFVFLALPDILSLNDKNIESKLKQFAPVAAVAVLLLNLARLPREVATDDFLGAILHLAIVGPACLAVAGALWTGATRFDKVEIFARMVVVLAAVFVAFVRWPFEGSVVVPEMDGGELGADEVD
jgi:hypothetical protein